MLSQQDLRQRQRVIIWLLWAHAVGLGVLALAAGNGLLHSLSEAAGLMPWALAAAWPKLPYRVRSCAATLGLLSASAMLVHLMNGAIEAHFHFFVVIAVIALYQDWLPFLLAVGFVVFEHGVGGLLVPTAVYNHPAAIENPWQWAAIHAAFVLGECAALITQWRLSELNQAERLRAESVLRESQRALATLMSNLPGMAYRCANDQDWTMELVSEGCFDLTGYTPEDLTLGRVTFNDIVDPQDRDRVRVEIERAIVADRPFQLEYRIQTADGWERWAWEQGQAVRSANGSVLALEGFITDVTERRQAAQALAHQAQHDPLTDLPNRILLRHELQEALRANKSSGAPLALLMMDLDRFKEVNDTFGHRYGDELLQQVAARLVATLGTCGTLARLGGDEFGVLLPTADALVARAIAQQLLEALEAPFALGEHHVVLGASVGIALFPNDAADSETLLRYADVAMYVAKRSGSGFAFYAADQDDHTADRLALAGELRRAIDQEQLVLYYQPTVDCQTRRITGVEALVRWQHPSKGLIPPDQFIPLAEQSGIIKPLTSYVLQEALRQCRAWHDAGVDLTMSVNLSMRNLHDPQLPSLVASSLLSSGVPADRLNLEITESAIMGDPVRAQQVLAELRGLGVRMAIDDFGTGYSSLAYLKDLPVDSLKIDKSFVQKLATDASDRAIVRSAVELGHNLGLRVVAEGVEDTLACEQLARLGCDLAQGYYLGRPMPASDLDTWLTESPWGLARAA